MARIQGLKELNRKLAKMAPKAKAAAREAVIEGAQEIANLQQNLVPYDDGMLHDSIHITKPGETTPPYSQPGGSRTAGPEQAIITAGNTKVRYAHLVEYGTAPHPQGGMFKGTMHPGTAPQPFFWPAYRALKRRTQGRISRAINKAVRDAATGGGK